MSKALRALLALLLIYGVLPFTVTSAAETTEAEVESFIAIVQPATPEAPPDGNIAGAEAENPPGQPSDQNTAPPLASLMPEEEQPAFLTGEALQKLVQENEGGTVVLTGDVRLTADVWLNVLEPTQVQMGEYGILIPEEYTLGVEGPLSFQGEGTRVPLFQAAGGLFIQDWAEVTASGVGATAIWYQDESPRWLQLASVRATGTGGIAIRGEGLLTAVLCNLAAPEGEVFQGPLETLQLDGCRAEPMPAAGQVVERRMLAEQRLDRVGVLLEPGTENWTDPYYWLTCTFLDIENPEIAGIAYDWAPVWQDLPEDLSKPGSYVVSYTLDLPEWFPVEVPKQYVWFHIMDDSRPYLARMEAWSGTASILYSQTLPEEAEAIMWFSTDDGTTWQDVLTAFPDSSVGTYGAIIRGLDENATYLFRLTTTGDVVNGESNTIRLASIYDDSNWGDRDNGGRGPQDELPPNDDSSFNGGNSLPPSNSGSSSHGGGEKTQFPANNPLPEENYPELPEDINSIPIEAGTLPASSQQIVDNLEPGGKLATGSDKLGVEPVLPSAAGNNAAGSPKLAVPSKQADTIALPPGATIAVTGRELAAQRQANANGATLLGEGLKVVLPTALLEQLALPDSSVLAVRLDREATNQFEVAFWLDGQPVRKLGQSSFWVLVEWEAEPNTVPYCTGEDGVSYLAQQHEKGLAVFQLDTGGRYTLEGGQTSIPEAHEAMSTNDNPSNLIIRGLAVVLLLLAVFLFGRRLLNRKGGGKP